VIEHSKHRLFNAWFARHARKRIERTFGRVLVAGLSDVRAAVREAPVLLVANHSSWWDALVALYLSELVLRSDGFAMMDAANLVRVPFFRRVGAFGVDLLDPRDGARAVRYAAKLLSVRGRTLWIFPEGKERSPFEPLELRPGAAAVARVAKGAVVIPVGLRYVFAGSEQPDMWIAFGRPLSADVSSNDSIDSIDSIDKTRGRGVEAQRAGIACELRRIDAAIARRGDELALGFEPLWMRRPGRIAALAESLLARLMGR